MPVTSQTAESAKQFLLTEVIEQAQHDGVPLSDVERRMFLFSETSGHADFAANEEFESQYDSDEYERKIASLLKKAYRRDSKTVSKAMWDDSLAALQNEDFYGLVMVDAAGIPRPQPNLVLSILNKRMMTFLVTEAAVLGIAVLLIFDPFHSNWIRPGWRRLVLIPIFIGILWWLGERQRPVTGAGPPTR